MPIHPLFEWSETEQLVEVRVQLPGAARSKSDVFATDCLIKVNAGSYLLMLDLHGEVDPARTVCTFAGGEGVTFKLTKAAPGLWGRLEAQGSKEQLAARRHASIERAHALEEAERKARLERRQREERAAIDRQIELERRKRAVLEANKARELDAERQGLAAWRQALNGAQQGGGDESDYEDDNEEGAAGGREGGRDQRDQGRQGGGAGEDHPDYHGKGWWPSRDAAGGGGSKEGQAAGKEASTVKRTAHAAGGSDDDDDDDGGDGDARRKEEPVSSQPAQQQQQQQQQPARQPEESWRPLPPPRLRNEPVKVAFTQLEFLHLPAREQREEEIRAYKKQQGRDHQLLLADSADVSERQPAFLKDKGDALFKQGNHRGAVAAYARALELDPELPAVWSNRAAAHGKLGEQEEAAECARRAVELLRARLGRFESGGMSDEEVQAFRRMWVRALVRRGAAVAALGQLQAALDAYEEALKYDRSEGEADGGSQLRRDVEELRAAMAPQDAAALKARGAARFAAGDAAGAAEAFGALLAALPPVGPSGQQASEQHVAALSNRAAAHLVLGAYARAHADCCSALALLLLLLNHAASSSSSSSSSAAPAQTDIQAACSASEDASASGVSSGPPQDELLGRAAAAAWEVWEQRAAASCGPAGQERASLSADGAGGWVGAEQQEGVDAALQAWVAGGLREGDARLAAQGEQQQSGAGEAEAQEQQQQKQQDGQASFPALVGSLGRLLARRAACRGHLRAYAQAAEDFEAAARITRIAAAGAAEEERRQHAEDKARALLADAGRMRELQVESQRDGSSPSGGFAAAAPVGRVGA